MVPQADARYSDNYMCRPIIIVIQVHIWAMSMISLLVLFSLRQTNLINKQANNPIRAMHGVMYA